MRCCINRKVRKFKRKIISMERAANTFDADANFISRRWSEALDNGLVDKALAKQKELREAADLMRGKAEVLKRWIRMYS